MPFTSRDARRHTRKANTASKRRQFAHVANSMMRRGFSEGRAIRAANSAVKRNNRRSRRSARR